MADDVRKFLSNNDLDRYTERLIDEGFDTLTALLDITESDMQYLDIKLGHRRKLQRAISNLKGVSFGADPFLFGPNTSPHSSRLIPPALANTLQHHASQPPLQHGSMMGPPTSAPGPAALMGNQMAMTLAAAQSHAALGQHNAPPPVTVFTVPQYAAPQHTLPLLAPRPAGMPPGMQAVAALMHGQTVKTKPDTPGKRSVGRPTDVGDSVDTTLVDGSGDSTHLDSADADHGDTPDLDGDTTMTDGESASNFKRTYKRHPKPDPNAPAKPHSAYVLFCSKVRDELKESLGKEKFEAMSFVEVSRIAAGKWRSAPAELREPLEKQVEERKKRYEMEMKEYQKTEDFRNYQKYLHDCIIFIFHKQWC
ncbi:hypothetical protein HK102_008675 [Quaeritorhiza haematococci]|nr:hypothetical protein HK102_008675 [Quaeritorhiza haematococci]